jgi:Protein of unknown function (DUF3102)
MSNLDCVLAGLAERIDTLHSASLSSHRKSIEQAIECGRVLAEAKALVVHGQWLPWLEANTKVDSRTAQRWMRFAKNADAVLAKCATSADLTFAEIDRDLSAAVATGEDVPAELREVAEKVISLREGVGVYADTIDFEFLWHQRHAARAKRRRRARDLLARIDYAQQHQDEDHSDLWEAVASHLVECWTAHAEWFDEDGADLNDHNPEYVNLCRDVARLSSDDRRAYAYGVIFAGGRQTHSATRW